MRGEGIFHGDVVVVDCSLTAQQGDAHLLIACWFLRNLCDTTNSVRGNHSWLRAKPAGTAEARGACGSKTSSRQESLDGAFPSPEESPT
jgi:hypothetical protein